MKKLLIAALAAGSIFAVKAEEASANEKPVEIQQASAPILWGFGNYGIYSGYQLYGSLVNSEPTLEGYAEINANLPANCGYFGFGLWSNTDLTDKRRDSYGKAFNEWDPNLHWGKTFWFDNDQTWGLDYRATVVWYYYPHRRHNAINTAWGSRRSTATTMDFNHSFELKNPYVTPYLNVVHEYHESDANLLQFGLKKTIAATDALSFTPGIEFVWRNRNYGWCFPNYGSRNGEKIECSMATMKIGLDANYQLTEHFGLFAKVAYCHIVDSDMRRAAEDASGAAYGQYKDFAWGGVGVTFNF